MAHIVIATADEELRTSLSGMLVEGGYAVSFAPTWSALVEGLARPSTRLVMVEAGLPGLQAQGELLDHLAARFEHRPRIYAVGGPLPPFKEVRLHPTPLRRLVSRMVGPAIPKEERRLLTLLGVGARPLEALARLSRSSLPICIRGERGSGKKRVAEALHRLGGGGPFISLKDQGSMSLPREQEDAPVDGRVRLASPFLGTLYVMLGNEWNQDLVHESLERSRDLGWRLVVGTRAVPPPGVGEWAQLELAPLRKRHRDLRALTIHYMEVHRHALGLPRRRLGRGVWALLTAHRWDGNARELETFVVSMLSLVDKATIQPKDLPAAVRELVDPVPNAALRGEAAAFEAMVERQLRRVVAFYEQGGDQSLYDMVMHGAERPLLRLVLARTAGNQKAAAELLGVSRNTVRTHLRDLGIKTE